MKNRGVLVGIIVGVLGIIALIYYLLVPDTYNWTISYNHNSDQPYGYSILNEIMESNESVQIVDDDIVPILDSGAVGQKYIYINEDLYSDSLELAHLLSWVERGNEAIISTEEVPHRYLLRLALGRDSVNKINRKIEYLDSIYDLQVTAYNAVNEDYEYYIDDYEENTYYSDSAMDLYTEIAPDSFPKYYYSEVAEFNRWMDQKYDWQNTDTNEYIEITSVGYDKVVRVAHQVRSDTLRIHYGGFTYINHEMLDSNLRGYKPLGFIDEGKVVDFEVPYGEGTFRFHLTPMAFTNVHIIHPENWEYNQYVLGDVTDTVFFDPTYHFSRERGDYNFSGGLDRSPLYFILSKPALKWAWYILLGTVLIYFAFKLKRERSEIPVLRPNPNTSLEFAKAIGYLRRTENDLFAIADEMYVTWEATLRKSFRTTDIEKTLLGAGYISKFPEAKKEVETINNYKRKLVQEQSLEAYEVKIIHNLFVSLHKRISQ
ncbi:MAG: hypothetical protein SchgKO_22520 [Schleiferiaceae bacterium]